MKKNSIKRHETLKKFFALLLACAMLFTNVTGTATALEGETETLTRTEEQSEPAPEETSEAADEEEAGPVVEEPGEVSEEEAEPEAEAQPETETEAASEEESPEEISAAENPAEEASEEEGSVEEPAEEEEAAEESEQAFEEKTEEPESEQTFEEAEGFSFEERCYSMIVKVTASANAFPAGTTMVVKPVSSTAAKNAVEDYVDGSIEKIHAVDIIFLDAEGNEIEPAEPINVVLSASDINAENTVVVHLPDEGEPEVVEDVVVEDETSVSFESEQFSIYAIVETGEDARLSVVFHRADGSETTQMINERQIPQIDQYIFDPGAHEPEGSIFKGWTTEKDYDSTTPALTIAQVREAVKTKLNTGISDGDELHFYAMAFNSYEVTYLDERGIYVQQDQVLVRADAEDQTVKHDVTLNYTPYPTDEEGVSAEFIGWQQLVPVVTGEMVLYKLGDSFTFAEGVKSYTLKAYTEKGHWLSFDENLSGASYTEPQFIAIGAKPVTPSNPTRVGYTFDGWYTEDASAERDGQVAGSQFNFNNELSENTTVYAKWNKATTASYSVVIWKQNVDGEHYDYGETVTVNNATVGNNTYAVTANGSGVRINTGSGNTNKSYQFFHLRTENGIDAAKPVAAEGNTVINVYFDRDTITYNFRYSNSNTQTYSGLYGSAFTQWPDPGNGNVWHRTSGYGYNATDISFPLPLTEFNPTAAAITDSEQNNTEFTFTLTEYDQYYSLRVYKQTTSGTWSYTTNDLIATAPLQSGGTWYPTETYTGFTLNAYCTGTASASSNWTNITPTGHIDYRSNLNLRYSRNRYDIIYSDGIFVDGSGNPVDAVKREEIPGLKETGVYYESSISSKNKTPEYDGFVFLGWYDNESCVGEPYPFTTMPAHNVTLYAKWGLNEFQIKLHSNASTDDPIQYNSATQAETFYLNTGEKIGNVGGERIYYDLVGWYSDPEFKHAFDFDAIVVNKTTVQKYGKIYSESEINPQYPTTIGELNLYAKWRGKLVGSDGIIIEYVDGEQGTGATATSTDDEGNVITYVDGSFANAHGAFAAADPETYVFSHWEVQEWNGSAYVDSGVKVFPGETFEVKSADAKIVGEDGEVYTLEEAARIVKENKDAKFTYTVQVKAVYIEKDKELTTYIKWYYNYEDAPSDGLYQQSEGLKINQECEVPAAPTRDGYTFLGWIRGVEETEASTTSADHVTSIEDLFITYTDGSYDITKVAPDEMLVNDNAEIGTGDAYKYHHAMYAKWEENEVTIKYAVASDSEGMGTVAPAEETLKAATGTAAGSTATASSDMYIIDYWTVDDGTEHVGDAAKFVPSKNADGLYEEHTYYAHFKLNKAEVTVHHYLKGTTTQVADDETSQQVIGTEYTATPVTKYQEKDLTVDSYNPSQKVTVSVDGNVITIYYTLPLTITGKTDSKTYDGTPLAGEYTVEGALASDEDAIKTAIGTAPSITHVAESPKDYQAATDGIPGYYVVTNTPGKLTITPATLTIVTESDKKEYDGTPLTAEGTIDGLVNNETATFEVTGSQTEVGKSDNTYTLTWDGTAVETDYTVDETVGKLEVTKSTKELKVASADGEWTYDGAAHTKPVYTVTYGTEKIEGTEGQTEFTLSTGDKVTITPATTATITHVAQSDVDNAFTWTVENADYYTKGTDTVGKLTITPATLTIVTESATKPYDGTELTAEGTIEGFVNNETATFAVTGTQTEVGKSDNTYTLTWDGTAVESDYELDETIGKLEVTKNSKGITITSGTNTWMYDGAEHSEPTYTVKYGNEEVEADESGLVFTLPTGDTITISNTKTVKNVSDTAANNNTYDYVLTNADQYDGVTATYGTLTITARSITMTSATDSKEYDGTALTRNEQSDITLTGDGFVAGEGATYDITGTQTEVGSSENEFTYELNEGTLEENYEITPVFGTLTVSKTSKVVTITSGSNTWQYDGAEHSEPTYTVKYGDEEATADESGLVFTLSTGDTVTISNTKTVKNVSDTAANNNTYNYVLTNADQYETVTATYGTLTITTRSITMTSATDSKEYDGTALTRNEQSDITVTGDGFVAGEGATYDITGTQTEVGSSENTFTYELNEGTLKENYEITTANGTLNVSKNSKAVTIVSGDNSWMYDGAEHSEPTYTVKYGDEEIEADESGLVFTLPTGDTITISDAATVKNVSDTKDNNNTYSYVLTNADQYESVTATYGTLEITPRTVTMTSADDEKVYDGKALTNDTVTVTGDGWAEGEGATYDVTGTQTEVGNSKNTFTYTLNEGTNADNYTITTAEGTLTVTPVTDKVTVTITENSGSETYDGKEKTVTGYTVAIDNELYTEDDFTFSGDDTVKGTDAGSYDMELKPEDFANINKNFTNVEFVIVDGTLDIAKRKVTLTSATDEKVYDGKALTNDEVTVSGDGWAEGEGATYDVTGTQTDAGTSDNTFTYTLNEGTKADNYEITKTEGTLTVTPVTDKVTVTITENSGNEMYDGTEKTVTGYTVAIDNELYTEDDFTFSGDDTVKGTDAGSYDMELKAEDFANISENFTNVEFVIVDGTLEIAKREVTLTSATDSKVYDGTALTNDEVTVSGDGFAEGEGAAYDVTGTQTDAGTSDNTFTYTLNEGTKADNYTITTVEGTLTVTPVTDKVTVTITGHTKTEKYDGLEKNVEGYDVEISNPLYTEEDFTFSGTASANGLNAGTYNMGMTADDFENISINFTNVVFEVTDGKLEITKRQITLTSATDEKAYDGTELTNDTVTVDGDGIAETDDISFDVTGSQLYVGSSPNYFTYTITRKTAEEEPEAGQQTVIQRLEDAVSETEETISIADNYEITKVEGTLTVTDDVPDEDVVKKSHEGEEFGLGETITFTIEVTNIYDEDKTITLTELEGVELEQSVFEKVAPGETISTTATYVVTEQDILNGSFKNTVTAKFDGVDDPYEGPDEPTTEDPNPHLTVVKETTSEPANGEKYALGETIEYKITVTNDGNLTISDVKVTDDKTGDEWTVDSIKPGEVKEFTASYTVTEEDILAGSVVNNATATGKDPEGNDPEVVPGTTEDPTEDPNPHLTVNKETTSKPANGKTYALDETIEYKITVTNDGNLTISDVKVTDDLTGDEWTVDSLKPGESKEFTTSYKVTEEDIRKGSVTNNADAEGKDPNGEDPEVTPGTTEVPTDKSKSSVTIEKTITNKPANGSAYLEGETIEYKITATNDGNQTITDITVTDELTGDEWKIDSLAPGESKEFTASLKVSAEEAKAGKVVNTAIGTGKSANPDDEVEVTPGTVEAKTGEKPSPAPVPKTGDHTTMYLWVVIMLAAGLELASLIWVKKSQTR